MFRVFLFVVECVRHGGAVFMNYESCELLFSWGRNNEKQYSVMLFIYTIIAKARFCLVQPLYRAKVLGDLFGLNPCPPPQLCRGSVLLGGSWAVTCGAIGRVTVLITHIRGLMTPLIIAHEPPSRLFSVTMLYLSGFSILWCFCLYTVNPKP